MNGPRGKRGSCTADERPALPRQPRGAFGAHPNNLAWVVYAVHGRLKLTSNTLFATGYVYQRTLILHDFFFLLCWYVVPLQRRVVRLQLLLWRLLLEGQLNRLHRGHRPVGQQSIELAHAGAVVEVCVPTTIRQSVPVTQWQLGLHHNHSPIWTDTRSTLPRSSWQSLVCQHRYHRRGRLS